MNFTQKLRNHFVCSLSSLRKKMSSPSILTKSPSMAHSNNAGKMVLEEINTAKKSIDFNQEVLERKSSGKCSISPLSASRKKIVTGNKISETQNTTAKTRPFTVSVEGNIGSGKSTFLKYFSSFPNVATYQEPINLWTNVGGHNLLNNLYKDPKRWSFLFQSYVQLTRLQIHLSQTESQVKLIERSLHNNRHCFVEMGHDYKNLQDAEFAVLGEYFDFLNDNLDIGVDLIVYLRTTPEVVYERMNKRGRDEESGVPLEYLQRLHNYYDRWLIEKKPHSPPAQVLVIDADVDMDTMMKDYESNKLMILGQSPPEDKENNEPNSSS